MEFRKRRVGRTALEVTELGLGCATLAGNLYPTTDSDARITVIDAYDAGIRLFDTSPFYGYGRSEHLVGDALRSRKDWVLSTKMGRLLVPRWEPQGPGDQWKNPLPFQVKYDYSYDGAMRSYEDSLQRLGVDHIDIGLIHDIGVDWHGDNQPAIHRQAMEGAYKALDELRRNGNIKAIGIGVNESGPIADALEHGQWDCFLLAGRYTLLEQEPLDDLLPALAKVGASIIVGGPFNSGILAGRDTWNYAPAPAAVMERAKALGRVCKAHNVPLAAAALQFPLAHPVIASVIPGPGTAGELNQILEWWQTPIPAALWRDLKSEKLVHAEAPVPG